MNPISAFLDRKNDVLTFHRQKLNGIEECFLNYHELAALLRPTKTGRKAAQSNDGDWGNRGEFSEASYCAIESKGLELAHKRKKKADELAHAFLKAGEKIAESTVSQKVLESIEVEVAEGLPLKEDETIARGARCYGNLGRAEKKYSAFQMVNDLVEEAKAPKLLTPQQTFGERTLGQTLTAWSILLSILIIEIVFQYLFWRESTDPNMAFPLALLTVTCTFITGFALGWFPAKWKNHRNRWISFCGWASLAAGIGFAIWALSLIASWREIEREKWARATVNATQRIESSLKPSPTPTPKDERTTLTRLMEKPAAWADDTPSACLFFLSLACFLGAIFEGYFFTGDTYPGYWKRRRECLSNAQKSKEWEDSCAESINEWVAKGLEKGAAYVSGQVSTLATLEKIYADITDFHTRWRNEELNAADCYRKLQDQYRSGVQVGIPDGATIPASFWDTRPDPARLYRPEPAGTVGSEEASLQAPELRKHVEQTDALWAEVQLRIHTARETALRHVLRAAKERLQFKLPPEDRDHFDPPRDYDRPPGPR